MKKDIAKKLMDILFSFDNSLESATQLTELIEDENERKLIRKGIGEIGSRIYTDLMRPIIKQYPDLDPDK